jgi:hypothetical protein
MSELGKKEVGQMWAHAMGKKNSASAGGGEEHGEAGD